MDANFVAKFFLVLLTWLVIYARILASNLTNANIANDPLASVPICNDMCAIFITRKNPLNVHYAIVVSVNKLIWTGIWRNTRRVRIQWALSTVLRLRIQTKKATLTRSAHSWAKSLLLKRRDLCIPQAMLHIILIKTSMWKRTLIWNIVEYIHQSFSLHETLLLSSI